MALQLESLQFSVDTTELKSAITELGKLGVAVSEVNKKSADAAIKQEKLALAQEKTAKAAAEAALAEKKLYDANDKSTEAIKKRTAAEEKKQAAVKKTQAIEEEATGSTLKGVDRIVAKTEYMAKYVGEGFRTSAASVLTQIQLLGGATEDQSARALKALASLAANSKNPFDSVIGPIQSINHQLEKLTNRANLSSQGIGLSSKQLEEYSRIYSNIASQFAAAEKDISAGQNHKDFTKMVTDQQDAYIKTAKAVNDLELQEKKRNDELNKTAKGTNESAKAMSYVEREMARAKHALDGFNEGVQISTSNRLLKFKEMLHATGVEASKASTMLKSYEATLKATQAAKTKADEGETQRRINNLSRGLAPQVSDVAVSLYGGMSPMTVLMQQGLQVRDLIQSSGVEAKDLAATLKQTGADFVGTLGGTFKAIGSLGVGVLASLGQSVVDLTGKMFFLGTASEAVVSKLEKLGYTDFAASLKNLGAVMTGVLGAAIAVGVVQLVALAVALKEVIKQESELSKAVNLTGGAIALNTQEAVNLASAYAGTKGNIGAYTEAITEAAKAGNISSDSLQAITTSAIELEKVAGVAVKDTIKQFSELAKSPTEAAIKLAESTGLIKPEVIAVVAELERQGDKANAAAIATRAYADSLLDATKVIKSDMSTWEIIFGSIGSSASSMWDRILNVGRKGDLNKQLKEATSDLDVRTKEGRSWYQTDAAYKEELARLKEIEDSLKNHVQVQQDQVKLKEDQRKATEAQSEVEKILNKHKEAQEKLSIKQGTRQEAVAKAEEKLLKLRREGATITDQAIEQEKKLAGVRWDDSQKKTGKSDAQRELERIEKETASVVKSFDAMRAKSTGYVEDLSQAAIKLREIQQGESWGKMSDAQKQRILNAMQVAEIEEHIADMVKDQLKDQLALQKVWDESVKKQAQIDQANFDALYAIDAKYATQVDAYDLLVLEASLIGKTTEEQKKVLGLKKIELEYEKEIQAIENKKGIDDSTRKALLDKQLQIRKQAELNLNTEITNDAARKLLEEYNRIRDGISDAIVTALFEGGKAGSKKLRDFLVAELKRPITIYVQAVVSDLMGLAGIGSGTSSGLIGSSISSMGSSFLGAGGIGATTSAFTTGASAALGGADLTAAIAAYTEAGMSGVAAGLSAGGSVGSALSAIPGWGWALAGAALLAGSMDDSGTSHTGGSAQYSAAGGTQTSTTHGAFGTGFGGVDYGKDATTFASNMAQGTVGLLDATATAFGKKAGYTAAAAFADDTSADGAWGGLLIQNAMGQTEVNWNDTRTSKWAPREFADGESGAKEYALAVARDVRNVLMEQTPDWADTMLMALGDAPSLEALGSTVDRIVSAQNALTALGNASITFAGITDESVSSLINSFGSIEAATASLGSYYENYYSAEEKRAVVISNVATSLREAGVEISETDLGAMTRNQYREMVDAYITNNGITDESTVALLRNANAFASVTDTVDSTTEKLKESTNALNKELEKAREEQAKLAEAQVKLIEDANDKAIAALKKAKESQQAIYKAFQETANSVGDVLSNLTRSISSFIDNLSLAADKTNQTAKKLFEARYAKALTGDKEAIGDVVDYAKQYLEATEKTAGSAFDYRLAKAQTRLQLQALPAAIKPEELIVNAIDRNTAKTLLQLVTGFTTLDTTADGLLTADELIASGLANDTTIREVIANNDANKDGIISAADGNVASLIAAYDLNKDGIISASDMNASQIIQSLDRNGDGMISVVEALTSSLGLKFDALDVSLDGALDLTEFTNGFKGLASDAMLQQIFNQLDVNGDGTISRLEAIGDYTNQTAENTYGLDKLARIKEVIDSLSWGTSGVDAISARAMGTIANQNNWTASDISEALSGRFTPQEIADFLQQYGVQLKTGGISSSGYSATSTATLPTGTRTASGTGGFVIGGGATVAASSSGVSSRYTGSLGIPIYDPVAVERLDSINSYVNTMDWGTNAADSAWATYQDAQQYGVTQQELAIATGYSLADINALFDTAGVPRFADGGFHSGGMRLVGENSPELEITGPARYMNADQMYSMMTNGSQSGNEAVVEQLNLLRYEVRAVANNTGKLQKIVDRLVVDTNEGSALQTVAVPA